MQAAVSASSLERGNAEKVLQCVKVAPKCEIVDVGNLCQPLPSLAYPYLGSVAAAQAFLQKGRSKWDSEADHWLVCPKLYY